MNRIKTRTNILRKAISLSLIAAFLFTNAAVSAVLASDVPTINIKFVTDLTQLGREGRLRESLGFEAEVNSVIAALEKGGKQPVIVDENGSVQDEIVEQIALRLASDKDNKKSLLKLETTTLYSNLRDTEKFDAAVASIVDTVLATKGTSVLFVESLTALASAKRQNTAFVEAVRSGKLKLIGASTFAAYQEEIAADAELSKLFQVVIESSPRLSVP